MFCKYCGTQLDDGSAFCIKCGRAQTETKTMPPEVPAQNNNSSTYKLVCLIIIIVFSGVFILIKVDTRTSSSNTAIPISEEYMTQHEQLEWYTSLDQIRIKTSDPIPANVSVSIALGYKKDDKQAYSEITARRIEIIDYLHRYFSSKTAEQLKPEREDELKIEIHNGINDNILSNSKIHSVLISIERDGLSQ